MPLGDAEPFLQICDARNAIVLGHCFQKGHVRARKRSKHGAEDVVVEVVERCINCGFELIGLDRLSFGAVFHEVIAKKLEKIGKALGRFERFARMKAE